LAVFLSGRGKIKIYNIVEKIKKQKKKDAKQNDTSSKPKKIDLEEIAEY